MHGRDINACLMLPTPRIEGLGKVELKTSQKQLKQKHINFASISRNIAPAFNITQTAFFIMLVHIKHDDREIVERTYEGIL